MKRIALLLFSAVLLTIPELASKPSSKISSESILRPSRIRAVSMSPDGKYVAGLAPIDGKQQQGLAIIDLETMKIRRSFAWDAGQDIYRFRWMNSEDIAFNVAKWDAFANGVFGVNVNRNSIYPLIADDAVVEVVDSIPHESNAWIWIKNGWRVKPSLALLNESGNAEIRDGSSKSVASTGSNPLISNRISQPPGDVYWWYTDWNHTPRIVSRFYQDKLEYLHRNNENEEWTPLALDPEDWDIHLFGPENATLYISGYNGEDTKGLYLYDIETKEIGDLLFRDEYYDFADSAGFMTYKDRLVGIHYQKNVPAVVWFTPEMEAIQRMLDGALPGRANIVYDWSDDFTRHLVYSYSDINPPEYLLLDLNKKSLNEISKSAPWLDYDKLAKTEVFHFKTRDGLKIEGYLTRPPNGEAPYPTVCLVHGGPWSRDYGTYDDETQFLANRGYAVLRVNYRGSDGYGKKVSEDYDYDFRAMHDDITEAVNMAVKHGIADPERLAIMGASFGGYAALCGAVFEPDLYKCAITNMGVFDWEKLIQDRKQQKSRYSHHKLLKELGDPKVAQERFLEISPIHHTEKIEIPIFIIHGKNDKNVSVRHSKELAANLKKRGLEHETLFVGGEGHNIFDVKNRVKVYDKIIDFLDRHMK